MIVGRDGCIKCGSISVSECSIWYVLASVFDISQHKTGKFAKITIVALGSARVNVPTYCSMTLPHYLHFNSSFLETSLNLNCRYIYVMLHVRYSVFTLQYIYITVYLHYVKLTLQYIYVTFTLQHIYVEVFLRYITLTLRP